MEAILRSLNAQYVVQRVPAVDSEGFSLPPPPSKEDSILDLAVPAVLLGV